MPPSSSPQDLSLAIAGLQKSLWTLMVYYKGQIKCILLVVCVYVFYKLGDMSVRDDRLERKVGLQKLIERRVKVRVGIPKRVMKFKRIQEGLLGVAVILILLEAVAYYTKIKIVRRKWGLILSTIIGLSISSLALIQLFKYFLNGKLSQNQTLQRNISKQLNEFQTALGPKVNKLLKHHLCKQQISKLHSTLNSADCVKPDCKELRSIQKVRVEAVEGLVNGVISFDWCSICRKRKHFDEYLGFEFSLYQERTQSEEEQIKHKIAYLLQGISRMHHWLTVTAPCNCSKLYWAMSTQKILEYKHNVKNVQERIKMLERRSSY